MGTLKKGDGETPTPPQDDTTGGGNKAAKSEAGGTSETDYTKGGRLEDWLEFEPMDGSETAKPVIKITSSKVNGKIYLLQIYDKL